MILRTILRRIDSLHLKARLDSFAWRQPLTVLAGFAWTGVTLDRWTSWSAWTWVGLMIASAIGMLGCLKWPRFGTSGLRVVFVCLLVLSLFALRHARSVTDYESATVLDVLDETAQPMIMVGTVDRPAQLRRDAIATNGDWENAAIGRTEYQTILQVRIESLRIRFDQVAFSGRAMVRVDGDRSDLLPGDRVKLFGQISLIQSPTNPGQRDMRDWAQRSNLHCVFQIDQVENILSSSDRDAEAPGAPERFSLWQRGQRTVASMAKSARHSILQQISPDQQGLALALVLGQRDLLDRSTSEALLVTGTAHLLSVSGLHLGILLVLARIVSGLLRLPLRGQLVFLAMVTLFYVAITGGRPPVLRAAILLATVVLSTAMARPYHPINSLSFAAILLAWWMPNAIFGVGMQLSFLAVATLLTCGRPRAKGQTAASQAIALEDHFDELARQSYGRWRQRVNFVGRFLATALWYSGCVSVITLPIVWQQFHVVSPISVLVNVVLSPLMAVALSAGVGTVIAGWVFLPLATIPGWICSQILGVMQFVINTASATPGGHAWLPNPSAAWVMSYYVVLLAIIAFRSGGHRRLPIGVWSLIWFVAAWWSATTPSSVPPGTYETTFVDVGHGTATILRPNPDDVWLYDCGWMGNLNQSSQKIDDVLWSMGVTKIRGIAISHADADHFNALPGLTKRFSIGCIITPPGMLSGEGAMLERTRRVIAEYKIPVYEIDRDQSPESVFDSAASNGWLRDVSVLHPPSQLLDANDNANSLVLRIDHGGRCLLLPGDLEPPGTSVLISTPRPPPGGVMMAPHHGSLRMDADAVLQWARPRETVVSGGKRAAKIAVTEMLSAAGGGVQVTSKEGAIRVRMGPSGELEIRSWLESPW
ncbi:ComEC/Rec2 family competence protein [Aporhodopirellula aestuarii]|uniref:ComEC/Rec2 family competence protein n=1 Tax=Aporhodopirellula aestuarii TaxID=2950107 RepID=A0ABT0U8S5_9BACT|nr:ComEC/Rec2 family competence protein [Aporhodopirellula aestuarii]MCM2373362.1 ComEC/Rec2 family competence protein [Aporhodopirellula aestuarii]